MKISFRTLPNVIFTAVLLLMTFQSASFAQLREDLKNEILVYVMPGAMLFPAAERARLTPAQLSIPSAALQQIINRVGVSTIARAFPDFTEADSIKLTDEGREVSIPRFSRIYSFRVADTSDIDSAIAALERLPEVMYAERNMDAYPGNDDDYWRQWHLNNTGQFGGTVGADIEAENAWSIYTGSAGVLIGIIDTGVDLTHDDLDGKSSGDSFDPDDSGKDHGTHVAGLAAGIHNNIGKIRGIDANAQILSKQILNSSGYVGDVAASNKIIAAVDAGAHVLNHSWGGTIYSSTLRSAFVYAYKMNKTSVVIMHNWFLSGNPTVYPAAFGQGIIAVGATTDLDVRSSFSGTGNYIDVVAPGSNIHSSITGNGYDAFSGTSMAAPQVSGIASLLIGYANDNLSLTLYNDDIEQIIKLSAEKVRQDLYTYDSNGWHVEMGMGRVNARAALDMLRSPNVLNQLTASGGGSTLDSGWYTQFFIDVPGLQGLYWVKRYKVTKSVTFPNQYTANPDVWGRGVATTGFSTDPQWGLGWNNPVSGTVTTTGAMLKTYIYEVREICLGEPEECDFLGWFPTTAGNVQYAYTVLGEIEGSQTGTIPTNTTWTDDVILYGDVTLTGHNVVSSGVKMEILPGSTLYFNNGAKLKVDGQLIAEGTPSSLITFRSINDNAPHSSWWWVYLDQNSGPQNPSSIKYCHFQDANYGIRAEKADNAVVENNTFENLRIGTYIRNEATPTESMLINNNQYTDLRVIGIAVIDSDPIISNNTITNTSDPSSNYGWGIQLISSTASLKYNTLTGSKRDGVHASGSGEASKLYYHPTLSPDGGGNTITSNLGHGVYVTDSAAPILGWSSGSPGNNIIFANSGKEIYNNTSSAVNATCNDWNGTPIISEFFGVVYYMIRG